MGSNGDAPPELCHKYAPKHLRDIYGQPEVVQMLEDMLHRDKLPHSILFTGSSGVGKSSIAKILAREMKCNKGNLYKINAALTRGIDVVREIGDSVKRFSMKGGCKIYLFEEAHHLTRKKGGDAQTALLDILENSPSDVYFFLTTTEPNHLLKAIHTRCTEVKLNTLSSEAMKKLLIDICSKEKIQVTEEVISKLVEVSEGSARKALVLLNQVINLEKEEDQLDLIQSNDAKTAAIEIARALMDPRTKWSDMAKLLVNLNEEPETIRHLVLSYASSVMLKGGKNTPFANWIIVCFESNFYDSKKAGLIRACYEVLEKRG